MTAIARAGEPDAPAILSGLTISVNDWVELNSSRLRRFSIIGKSFDNTTYIERIVGTSVYTWSIYTLRLTLGETDLHLGYNVPSRSRDKTLE
jgi:hypothetical protein